MKDNINQIDKSIIQPSKNYKNFKLEENCPKAKKVMSQIMKSRLRRYNDANHQNIEEVFDVIFSNLETI